MSFKKAERRRVKLKLGISGPSGSGKTFSGLRIAKGLLEKAGAGKRIALIDTENRSASLYAESEGMPEFDVLELTPPYTVDKYMAAINEAIKQKYDLLIVDSVSHVWSGEGGLLQEKEALDTRGGNSYTNWAKMTPKWNKFVSAILHSDIHMICTMRAKQDYVLETNDKGKQAPKKVGMAPQVREGFEYELTAVFDMDMSHQAQASKDRTSLFDGRTWVPNEETGIQLFDWLMHGKEAEAPKPQTAAPATQPKSAPAGSNATTPPAPQGPTEWKATKADLERLTAIGNERGWAGKEITAYMEMRFKKTQLSLFTKEEYDQLCGIIRARTSKEATDAWQQFLASEAQREQEPSWGENEPTGLQGELG